MLLLASERATVHFYVHMNAQGLLSCVRSTVQLNLCLCRNIACDDPGCKLCQYNPNKTCQQHTDSKYIAFENLRSRCGADLHVQLADDAGSPVAAELLSGIHLQVRVHFNAVIKTQFHSQRHAVLVQWSCFLAFICRTVCTSSR